MTSLAHIYQLTPEALAQANCLMTTSLFPGVILYVPPIPTKTSIPCGSPAGWVKYIVNPDDTLYRLSLSYGITVKELQLANCMGASTLLVVGKAIYVPPWIPTLSTSTPTTTPTMMPSYTPSPVYRTETITPTFTPSPTATPTDTTTP